MTNFNSGLSNFHVEVTARGKESLAACLRLFFYDKLTVTDYAVTDKGLEIYKYPCEYVKTVPLPYKMNYESTLEIVWNWLLSNEDPKKFDGPQPSIDGSVSSEGSFCIKNNTSDWSAKLFTVKPVWGLHHK